MADTLDAEIASAKALELREAELEKIRSETARNAAEERKQDLEAQEIGKRLNQKWFRARFFMESLVGGLVAAGLLSIWFVDFFGPQLGHEIRLEKLKNAAQAEEAKLQKAKNESETLLLKDQNYIIKQQLAALKTENKKLAFAQKTSEVATEELKQNTQNLVAYLSDLSDTDEIADEERARFADLAEIEQKKVKKLEEELVALRIARDETQKRQELIRKQQISGTWEAVVEGDGGSERITIRVDDSGDLKMSTEEYNDITFRNIKLVGEDFSFEFSETYLQQQEVAGSFSGKVKNADLIEGILILSDEPSEKRKLSMTKIGKEALAKASEKSQPE